MRHLASSSFGTGDAVTVRDATIQDLPALVLLKQAVEDETYREYGTAEEHAASLEVFAGRDYVHDLLDTTRVLVAQTSDAALVGMVSCLVEGSTVMISGLYCSPSGIGTGTFLMRSAVELVGDDGDVRLEVFVQNHAAITFFRRLGFEFDGTTRPSRSYAGSTLALMTAPARLVRRATTLR